MPFHKHQLRETPLHLVNLHLENQPETCLKWVKMAGGAFFLERQQMSVPRQSFLRDNAIDCGFSKEECDCPRDLCSFLNHKVARLLKRKLGRSSSKDLERKALVQNCAVDGAME